MTDHQQRPICPDRRAPARVTARGGPAILLNMRPSVIAVAMAGIVVLTGGCSSAPPPDAQAVVNQLGHTVTTVRSGAVVTAENDSNHLLGRPGGYLSKSTFTDTRIQIPEQITWDGQTAQDRADYATQVDWGGSVEVFADEKGAKARQAYIQTIAQAAPALATEYDYQTGSVLLRVSGKLTPAQAGEYERALAGAAKGSS